MKNIFRIVGHGYTAGLLIVGLLITPLLVGCRPASDSTVRLQLNWFPDAQHGGYYAAEVHNCFDEEGLSNVQILKGGPGTPVIPKLLMGQVDFAIANADQVLMARAQERTDVVALFAPLQNSPRCIMVHESSGVTSLAELKDVTLAMGEGKGFAEFLKSQVPLENVRVVPYSGTVAKFLVDENYAQQGYVFTEPLIAQLRGGDPRSLMVSELGFNPYTSVLLTRRDLLDSDPELVGKVVRAVRRGWQRYLADAAPTNKRIRVENPELDAELLDQAANLVRELCLPDGMSSESVGMMTAVRWQTLASQLQALGLATPETVEGAFSLDFLGSPVRGSREQSGT
jgi:NitT/TauT family transport system substrate-binding protein